MWLLGAPDHLLLPRDRLQWVWNINALRLGGNGNLMMQFDEDDGDLAKDDNWHDENM